MNNIANETFDKVICWLREDNFEVITSGSDFDEYKTKYPYFTHVAVVWPPPNIQPKEDYGFNLVFLKNRNRHFEIRGFRKFTPLNRQLFMAFTAMEKTQFYKKLAKTANRFDVLVLPRADYQIMFKKHILIENLTRQSFLKSVKYFLHVLELVRFDYDELQKLRPRK